MCANVYLLTASCVETRMVSVVLCSGQWTTFIVVRYTHLSDLGEIRWKKSAHIAVWHFRASWTSWEGRPYFFLVVSWTTFTCVPLNRMAFWNKERLRKICVLCHVIPAPVLSVTKLPREIGNDPLPKRRKPLLCFRVLLWWLCRCFVAVMCAEKPNCLSCVQIQRDVCTGRRFAELRKGGPSRLAHAQCDKQFMLMIVA